MRGGRCTSGVAWAIDASTPRCAGPSAGSRGQDAVALPDVFSPAPDVPPGIAIVEHSHATVGERRGVLLADDAVGARGNRRPGEDARRLPGRERPLRELAGGHGLHDAHGHPALACRPGDVRRAHRVPIHAGIVPRREVHRTVNVLGQHQVECFAQRAALRPERRACREHQARSVCRSEHLTDTRGSDGVVHPVSSAGGAASRKRRPVRSRAT